VEDFELHCVDKKHPADATAVTDLMASGIFADFEKEDESDLR